MSTYKFSKSYLSLQKLWKWEFYINLMLYEITISKIKLHLFISMARQSLLGQGLLTVMSLRSHCVRNTTLSRAPLGEWSAHSRDFYQTSHYTRKREISCPGGVRTHNLAKERLQTHALDRAATGISIFLYKETIFACWMCAGARRNDYLVSNIISTEKYGTVQRTCLYISSDPLRRANTQSDVSSPFHLHWIALGQISQDQGNTSGRDEVHR